MHSFDDSGSNVEDVKIRMMKLLDVVEILMDLTEISFRFSCKIDFKETSISFK
jgi:hypothetical protein